MWCGTLGKIGYTENTGKQEREKEKIGNVVWNFRENRIRGKKEIGKNRKKKKAGV